MVRADQRESASISGTNVSAARVSGMYQDRLLTRLLSFNALRWDKTEDMATVMDQMTVWGSFCLRFSCVHVGISDLP